MFFGKNGWLRRSRFKRPSFSTAMLPETLEVRCLLSSVQVIGSLPTADAVSSSSSSTVANEWDTYQGNPAHTGYVQGSYNFSNASLQWQATVAQDSVEGLAVGGGTILVTNEARFSNATSFQALSQDTGAVLWSKSYGSNNDTTSPPAYANGIAYVQTDANTVNDLNAYNVNTGALVFQAPYSAQWETYLNPTPYGGNMYVGGGEYGGMYSFNATTGAQNWFGSVPQYDGWTPAIDGTYAYAYTGSGDTTPIQGVFSVINLATGATAASVVDPVFDWTGYTMNSAVVLGSHNDAFTINGHRLVSWDTALDSTDTPHIAWSLTDGYTGQPTLANGYLYVINNGELNVLNEMTGQLVWSWAPPSGSLAGTMIATDNEIFVQTSSTTYAIDLTSHSSVWSYAASGTTALAGGDLYVGGTNGVVYAFAGEAGPDLSAPSGVNVDYNTAFPFSGTNSISLSDPSGTAEQLKLTVSHGILSLTSTTGVTVAGNNSATLTITGTLTNVNTVLEGLSYKPNTNYAGLDTLTVADTDTSVNLSIKGTVKITVAAPSITAPATVIATENGSFAFTGSNAIMVNDPTGNSDQLELKVTHGALSLTSTTGVSATGNNTADLVINGLSSNLNSVLAGLTFIPTNGYHGEDYLSLYDKDTSDNLTASTKLGITITPLAPTLSAPASASVVENANFSFSGTSLISVLDVGGTAEQLKLTASHGALSLSSTTGVTVTGNSSATLTITGTLANLNTVLQGLSYKPSANYAGADTLTIVDTDTSDNLSAKTTVKITVVPLPPSITAPTTVSARENNSVAFTSPNAITVNDLGGTAEQLQLKVAHGTLSLASAIGVNVTGSGTADLVISGSLLNLNSALQGLKYVPTNGYYGEDYLSLYDRDTSDNLTAGAKLSINVAPAAPNFTAPASVNVLQNTTLSFSGKNSISVSDIVGTAEQLKLTVAYGILSLASTTGVTITGNNSTTLTITGALTNVNTALQGLSYKPNTNSTGSDTLTITDTDTSDNQSAKTTVQITVVVPPSITAPTTVSVTENSSLAFTGPNAISVNDLTGITEQLTLKVAHGILSLVSATGVTVTGNGTADLVITGSLVNLNSVLAGLTYSPTNGYSGMDYLSLYDRDISDNLAASDKLSVNVTPGAPHST